MATSHHLPFDTVSMDPWNVKQRQLQAGRSGSRQVLRRFARLLLLSSLSSSSSLASRTVRTLHDNGVHHRLQKSLRVHVAEFENVTLPIFQRGQQLQDVDSFRSDDKPLTLKQAHTIHQLALQVSHQVQRTHGQVTTTDVDTNPPMTSSAATSRRGLVLDASSDPPSCRFSPLDYGADPTGQKDSTRAFAELLQDLLACRGNNNMAANITNLGGATLDLQGGTYKLSQPLLIPPYFGNLHITDGTLQACPCSFPQDRWLIEIGSVQACQPINPDGTPDQQLSCNEYIDVTSVFLDANFRAAGGIRVSRVMGTVLSNVFVTGFVQVGILISNGHEVMISNAWLAECYWSNNDFCIKELHSTSVGIRIDGMDHYVTNTIVFDFAKVGVEIWQPANLLQGVHTWNGGGRGIVIGQNASKTTHSIRLVGCYLDFETLDIWDPSHVLVESTFFYYGHAILRAGNQATVDGLTMRFNYYSNSNQDSVVLDGRFVNVKRVSILEEVDWYKTTKATQRLQLTPNTTEFQFDFTEQLLFPTIDHVMYTLTSSSPKIISHMARPPNGTQVTVVLSEPIDAADRGAIYVTVEQGNNY